MLGNPQVFLLTTGDVAVLPKLLDAAERYAARPTDEEMAALDPVAVVHVVASSSRSVRSSVAVVERLLQERAARRQPAARAAVRPCSPR